jgi:hypothetical protein
LLITIVVFLELGPGRDFGIGIREFGRDSFPFPLLLLPGEPGGA